MALTRRQRQVLDVIREFIDRNGYSPSLEEIAAALGLSSVATVHKHVSHLVQKGPSRILADGAVVRRSELAHLSPITLLGY